MSEKKKKIDKIFLCITLISFLTFIIIPKYALDIVSGIILGFGGTSLIFGLGIRRLEQDKFKRVYSNLFKNIVIYTITMLIAMKISFNAFLVCVVVLTMYRIILLNSIRK